VVSSFTPEVDVIDVAKGQSIKRLSVISPFSPFLQFTPDFREIWMTHKDVGKVTRIDTEKLEVKGVIDTGLVTNHLGFAKTARGTLAYVTVGGENIVKVYTTDAQPRQVATIAVGALPHGVWPSDDGSRMYVGLENGDGVDVIDTASDKVIARIPVGQAPQALVYVSNAVGSGDGTSNLVPKANSEPINIALRSTGGDAKGFVVARNLGITDSLEVFLYKLKPQTVYNLFMGGQRTPVGSFKTNPAGMGQRHGDRAIARGREHTIDEDAGTGDSLRHRRRCDRRRVQGGSHERTMRGAARVALRRSESSPYPKSA
jgi:YVTN family beta-propeller protein